MWGILCKPWFGLQSPPATRSWDPPTPGSGPWLGWLFQAVQNGKNMMRQTNWQPPHISHSHTDKRIKLQIYMGKTCHKFDKAYSFLLKHMQNMMERLGLPGNRGWAPRPIPLGWPGPPPRCTGQHPCIFARPPLGTRRLSSSPSESEDWDLKLKCEPNFWGARRWRWKISIQKTEALFKFMRSLKGNLIITVSHAHWGNKIWHVYTSDWNNYSRPSSN